MKHISFFFVLILLAACGTNPSPNPLLTAESTDELPPATGHIVFQSNSGNNIDLILYTVQTAETERITNTPERDEEASFSRFDSLIFQRFINGNYELVRRLSSGEETVVTNTSDLWERQAVFSHDGEHIAFVADLDAADDELFIADVNASNPQQATDNDFLDAHPSFSPDGSQIVFQSNRDGNNELYILHLESNEVTRLTNHPADDIAPAWSPDGEFIAFVSNREGSNDIYLISPDAENLIRLTLEEGDDTNPAWSPDSAWIAFQSDRAGSSDIWIMREDGTELSNIGSERNEESHPTWGQ